MSNIYKTFTNYYLSSYWLIGSLFFVFIGFNFIGGEEEGQQQYQYNSINIVWAEDINGTENADTIIGTIDRDKIKGFGGNDIISGREAGDDISGGSGDDMIYGNDGKDILRGKAGNDSIEGGEGNDRINGDRGNDMLLGGFGNDTLTGGPGKDTFICGKSTDTIIDFNAKQQDKAPFNDCENIKNVSRSGKTELKKSLTLQQEQEQNGIIII
jgi:Ca2+-binding RTX toxin-like protein